jgi:4-hydroxythreonine-4-phosphate dehydrogenase
MLNKPRLLLTLGDVAGIGPEVVVRAWRNPELHAICLPIVVGDVAWLRKTISILEERAEVVVIREPDEANTSAERIPCLQATDQELDQVQLGRVSAKAGRAAYDFLCRAIDLCLAGQADGLVTLPLHKEGLHAAGLPYPGHTEILAERTGSKRFAMMLYYPSPNPLRGAGRGQGEGFGVTHVTLHMALRDVFAQLSPEAILEKIVLTDTMLARLLGRRSRIGVCGLNPHAGDGGLFGDEERNLIAPAVQAARKKGIQASGPWPSDTLFLRAKEGDFDGLVAMYHDQGHIAVKLLAGYRAVNISLGLPIVRTSVAHGTAYDIAGKGLADAAGLIEAVRMAARLSVVRSP